MPQRPLLRKHPVTPGELGLGTLGYGFGLGFAVRLAPGIAAVPGSQGDYMWAGYAGTQGGAGGGVHEPGAEPDPCPLPPPDPAAGLPGNGRLTNRLTDRVSSSV